MPVKARGRPRQRNKRREIGTIPCVKLIGAFLTFKISQNRLPAPSVLRRRSGKVGAVRGCFRPIRPSRGCNGAVVVLQRAPRWKTTTAPLQPREGLIAQERKCHEFVISCNCHDISALRKTPKMWKIRAAERFFRKVPKDFMLTVRHFLKMLTAYKIPLT